MDIHDYDYARSEHRQTMRAIVMLESLVGGRNPVTQKILPRDCFTRDVTVSGAIWIALRALDEKAERQNRKIERIQRKLAE